MQAERFFTKRNTGLVLLLVGVVGVIGIFVLDLVRGSDSGGIGPAQRLGLLACGGLAVFGVTLIPLGSRPLVGETGEALPTGARSGLFTWANRILIGFALLIMLGHGIVFVHYGLSLTAFPFDYDQGEGFELNDTILFSQGQWPYRDNEVYPFYASNYPPLYHVILVPFVWLFGPQYWYGRLLGLAATLITSGAIGYAVYRGTKHKPAALLSGLAFLASNYVYHIGPLFRQHMSMVMFETLAVVIIAGISAAQDSKQQRRRLLIGLGLLLAAGYTKQLAIVTCGAVFVYLFLRWPRRALTWGAGFAAVAGLIFLWINLSTSGQWWLNIITANVNEYIFSQFMGLLRQFIGLHGAILLLALAMIVYEMYLDRLSLYSMWFVAAAVNGVLAGKWGAGDSYFATMIAATCILAGLFAGRCLNRVWRIPPEIMVRLERIIGRLHLSQWIPRLSQTLTPLIGLVACGLYIAYGLAVIHLPLDGPVFGPLAQALRLQSNTKFANFYDSAGWTMGYATIGQIPSAADIENGRRIVETARAASEPGKPILSEEAAFSFHLGKAVVTNPTQLLNLYLNKHYDPANLVAMIDERAFSVVIFRARFYPQPVLDAIDRAYVVREKIPMNGYEYTIMVPNDERPVRVDDQRFKVEN